jgi:hypothetical protein
MSDPGKGSLTLTPDHIAPMLPEHWEFPMFGDRTLALFGNYLPRGQDERASALLRRISANLLLKSDKPPGGEAPKQISETVRHGVSF